MTSWISDFLQKNPEMAEHKVLKRSRTATHFEIAPGVARAVITGAPQYFREGGEWRALDMTLRADETGWLGAPGSGIRIRTNGETNVLGGRHQQRTTSVGLLDKGVYVPLHDLPVGQKRGSRLIREVGLFRHESVLIERGIKEQLIILDKPAISGDGLLGYVSEVRGNSPAHKMKQQDIRDYPDELLPPGNAEDANGNRISFERHFLKMSGVDIVFNGIPVAELEKATFPVVVDPEINVTGETVDGYVRGYASGYSAARATSTDYDVSSDLFVGQALESAIPRYYVFRSFMKFDLGSLGHETTVLVATIGLTRSTTFSINQEFDVQVVKADWSASDPLTSGNKENAYDGCLSGSADVVWKNTVDVEVGQKHFSPPIDLEHLTFGTEAYYGLRSSRDKAGNAPTVNGDEYIRIASANHSTSAYRPELMIDYAAVFPVANSLVVPMASIGSYDTRNKLRAKHRNQQLSTSVRSKN